MAIIYRYENIYLSIINYININIKFYKNDCGTSKIEKHFRIVILFHTKSNSKRCECGSCLCS